MKVRCIRLLDESGKTVTRNSWAKIGETYHVLSVWVEPGTIKYRLVGEQVTPALFDSQMFEIVSSIIPESWQIKSPKIGCLALAPLAWERPGFWEDYFDFKPEAVECFKEERRKIIESDP